MSAIRCRDLRLVRNGRTILGPLDLDIEAGSRIAVIGPNGAGKSTLLKCLTRIHPDFSGNIELLGKNHRNYSQRALAKTIGYVPQVLNRPPSFSVEEFVLMGRYPHRGPFDPFTPNDQKLIDQLLEEFDLTHLSQRALPTLSGGERQRVLIAAALAQQPQILLLDEPLTFLDPAHQVAGAELLLKQQQRLGLTLINVTHDPVPAILHDYQILALKDGHLFYFGPGRALLQERIAEKLFEVPFQAAHLGADQVQIPIAWRRP